jgi:sialate O-acetylesterase
VDGALGLETVYWNGEAIGGRRLEDYGGDGASRHLSLRQYRIPARLMKAGANVVAIRWRGGRGELGLAGGYFDVGTISLKGEWTLKVERVWPALSAEAVADMPPALVAPLRLWNVPGTLYNGMIHPLAGFGLRGVVWYQGENNAGDPARYREAFPALVEDWRERWGAGDFAFYFCQLPSYGAKTGDAGRHSNWALLREAQASALALPNTGQAVLIDTGETADIHPVNKRDPGLRLAALALARTYGKAVPDSGPVFAGMSITGGSVRVRFTHAEGLVARPLPKTYLVRSRPEIEERPLVPDASDSPLQGFAIRGADGDWVWADARIDGETVMVSSPKVPKPIAVCYAWADSPTVNLYNAAGFPAAPFRSDQ